MMRIVEINGVQAVQFQDGDTKIHLQFWPTDKMPYDQAKQYAIQQVAEENKRIMEERAAAKKEHEDQIKEEKND